MQPVKYRAQKVNTAIRGTVVFQNSANLLSRHHFSFGFWPAAESLQPQNRAPFQRVCLLNNMTYRIAILLVLLLCCTLTASFTLYHVSKRPHHHSCVLLAPASEEPERMSSTHDQIGLGTNHPVDGIGENLVPADEQESNWKDLESTPFLREPNSESKVDAPVAKSAYNLGLGKNHPLGGTDTSRVPVNDAARNWHVPEPVAKPAIALNRNSEPRVPVRSVGPKIRTKRIVARNEATKHLKGAIWDEGHYGADKKNDQPSVRSKFEIITSENAPPQPTMTYPNIDLSIPDCVYSDGVDVVWDTLRYEAFREAEREPLLVSFMYSSILNHRSLESALAFHLANRLSSPAMISTQIQSLILEALDNSPEFRQSLRADMMAVRDRDPACNFLPDVFLYFKGFHALQTHRVAHYMYKNGRQVLAHYLQSQVSQNFQIDIHPNATIGAGVMMDHGTGIVVGETATIGHNCSILHHVTLGGSGKRGVDRHPKVGNGVLLGAGASVLGNVKIGEGCQIGAGTLVISDLPPHCVAVGVPAKIIGSFVDVTEQPSIRMNQMTGTKDFDMRIVTFESGGI